MTRSSVTPFGAAQPGGLQYRIGDRGFGFAAAHRHWIAAEPALSRLHGHTYTVAVELADSVLRPPGFVCDYGDLAPLAAYLRDELDHRDLDEALEGDTGTAGLAGHVVAWFRANMPGGPARQLRSVRVEIGAGWSGVRAPSELRLIRFEAAHHLDGLPAGHKCGRVHGHSYAVELRFIPGGNGERMRVHECVADYVRRAWDHRDLSEVLPYQATSELLAEHLFTWVRQHAGSSDTAALRAVRVYESPRRWAEFGTEASA